MVAHVRGRRAEGIRRFQLKLGADPREDAARVRAVLDATEEGDVIVADANGGWRLQDATIAARALEGLDRVLFEQPCPTLEECLIVRERTTLPMVLDEVITDVNALIRARGRRCDGDQPQDRPRRRAHQGASCCATSAPSSGCASRSRTAGAATSRPPPSPTSRPRRRPTQLLMASFMNDWTLDHIAGYEPRSCDGRGARADRPRPRHRRRRRGARRAAAQK